MMKLILISTFILGPVTGLTQDCQAPSQGFLETRIKETFHGKLGETELKEWMIHSSNGEIRQDLKSLDRRIKFSPQRLEREELLTETRVKFEQAIENTGRKNVLEHFPTATTKSTISATEGALVLEMKNIDKVDLDVIPKEILDKIDPKIKLKYLYPYDKFEYLLTYEGKEQPMAVALLKVQKDMEAACENRMIDNSEYKRWYKTYSGGSNKAISGSGGGGGAGAGSTGQ